MRKLTSIANQQQFAETIGQTRSESTSRSRPQRSTRLGLGQSQNVLEAEMAQQVFEVSSSAGGTWLAAFLLLPATLLLVAAVVFWPRPLRIEVSREAVQIRGSIYGRTIAKRDLDLDRARVVDLNSEPGLSPQLRTNGIGLANYRVGWFRLRNRERALCFLTGDGSVLYLPTRQHYALLVSTSDPGALLAALKGAD